MEVKVWLRGRLGYNPATDRYGFLVSDLWENDGFHCGTPMKVEIDDKWVNTRIEMKSPNTWYLVDTPYSGEQLEGLPIKVKTWVDSRYWDVDEMEKVEEEEKNIFGNDW